MPRSQHVSADARRADTRHKDGRHRFRLRCRAVGAVFVLASIFAVAAFPQAAAAQVPQPPRNGDCAGTAVLAKLSIVEDRAAANMLAEAVTILGLGQRCLVDAGGPTSGRVPPGSRNELSNADRVFVVGGPAAIPHDWLTSTLGVSNYTRIAGGNRWDTQSAVVSAIFSLARGAPVVAFAGQPSSTPDLPPNTGCTNAVAVKLNVIEDTAAANMLAEAFDKLSDGGDDRCLVDVGDPRAVTTPTSRAKDDYDYAEAQYVIGGTTAIPNSWLSTHFGERNYERLAGADRWDTQSAVARRIIELVIPPVIANDLREATKSKSNTISAQSNADLSNRTIVVHYCGFARAWSRVRLDAEVQELRTRVGRAFFENQFGDSGFKLNFRSGELLPLDPSINGDRATIAGFSQLFEDKKSPCEEALLEIEEEEREYSQDGAIDMFVADVSIRSITVDNKLYGIAGYAYFDGPIVMAIPEMYRSKLAGEDYFTVAAHEIGHAAYRLPHSWPSRDNDLDGDDDGCHDNNGLLGDDELSSIMSYTWPNPPCNRLALDNSAAHVSCVDRRKEALQWLTPGVCGESIPDREPDKPRNVQVTPGDGQLRIVWDSPLSDGGSPITNYVVSYRRIDGGRQWQAIQRLGSVETMETISGLLNGIAYEVQVRARNQVGTGEEVIKIGTPSDQRPTTVTLTVGPSAQGEPTTTPPNGICSSRCRWLNVDVEGLDALGPGPYSVVCAHKGIAVGSSNYRAGWFKWKNVASFPNSASCFFGFPGAEVYVVVGAQWKGGRWEGGVLSNTIRWPDCQQQPNRCKDGPGPDPRVQISWGTDGSNRSVCPTGIRCTNLAYQIEGLGNAPWRLNCGDDAGGITPFLWSGNPATGCLFWDSSGNVWVEVDGHRSNSLPRSTRPR